MRANSLLGAALALAVCLFFPPPARAQVDGCPQDICVKSMTTLVYNPLTNTMDAFTTATTDVNT